VNINPKKIFVDEFTEKPLSQLIAEMKQLLVRYRHSLEVKTTESNGKMMEVELRVRIQV